MPSPDEPATTIPVDRPVTAGEEALINWLLLNGTPAAQSFHPQLRGLRVNGKCGCGCPTIDLKVAESIPVGQSSDRILADFLAKVDGKFVGIILHQSGGYLRELEIYACGETPVPFTLPDPSTLFSFENSAISEKDSSQKN